MAAGDDSSVNLATPTGNHDVRLTANGDVRPVAVLGNAGDVTVGLEPFGALQVNNGFSTLFYDAWSSALDTTDKWTVTGTSPTISNSVMSMSATVSTYHAIRTKDTVRANAGWTYNANGITLEASAATGAGRFWGMGTTATTPAAAVLAQDGIGFEVDQATGALYAVYYVAGVRTIAATLPSNAAPTGTYANANATVPNYRDSAYHRFAVYYRATGAYWFVDNMQVPVASMTFPPLAVMELPALIVRYNAASFTGTPVFTNTATLTADTSRQGFSLSDPVVGTRMARVSPGGALTAGLERPLTTGTSAGNIFRARVNPTAITASTALVAAPGAGVSIYVTDISVTNAGATANLVSLLDGATGLFDIFAAASGGGGVTNLGTPLKLTAATALNYTTSAASSTYITVTGYYAA